MRYTHRNDFTKLTIHLKSVFSYSCDRWLFSKYSGFVMFRPYPFPLMFARSQILPVKMHYVRLDGTITTCHHHQQFQRKNVDQTYPLFWLDFIKFTTWFLFSALHYTSEQKIISYPVYERGWQNMSELYLSLSQMSNVWHDWWKAHFASTLYGLTNLNLISSRKTHHATFAPTSKMWNIWTSKYEWMKKIEENLGFSSNR